MLTYVIKQHKMFLLYSQIGGRFVMLVKYICLLYYIEKHCSGVLKPGESAFQRTVHWIRCWKRSV